MACTDPRVARALAGLVLLAALTGCESLPSMGPFGREPPAPAEAPTQPDDAGAEAEAPLEPIPDPYVTSQGSVPAQARAEFDAAREALAAGRAEVAAEQFASMTQRYPDLSGPWVNLGIARWRQNQLDAAATAFARALEINSRNGDAYTQWGVMERERGNFSRAESLYRDALRVWPHNYTAHVNLGVLLDLYMGRLEEALQHYRMAARIAGEPSRELRGWIIDLERRLAAG